MNVQKFFKPEKEIVNCVTLMIPTVDEGCVFDVGRPGEEDRSSGIS